MVGTPRGGLGPRPHPCCWHQLDISTATRIIGQPEAAAVGGFMFCLLFVIFSFIFNDFCQSNYLNIYRTDLHHI